MFCCFFCNGLQFFDADFRYAFPVPKGGSSRNEGLPEIGNQASSLVEMENVKDTQRALVRIGYDGKVHKTFRGADAEQRFATEVAVLQHLETGGCPFVPRLLENFPEQLKITTTNCGTRVDHLDEARAAEIFAELEPFGVRHEDREIRNITYSVQMGRFCVIDFEFATILAAKSEG